MKALAATRGVRDAAGELLLRGTLLSVNRAGWALDDVLMSGWKDVELSGPLFILGHQRSGTTLLHRLLAEDVLENACGLRFGSMLVPPLVWRKLVEGSLARADWMGLDWRERLSRWQDELFGPLDPVHRIRFDEVEEDEFALWTIYASSMVANDVPETARAPELEILRHPEYWRSARLDRVLGYYGHCLQKNVYAQGWSEGLPVSKNPAFGKIVPQLAARFPRASFVHLIRNPLEAIPSRLSMIEAIWRLREPGRDGLGPEDVETLVADSIHIYRATAEGCAELAPRRVLTVDFQDLVENTANVVQRISEKFGYGLKPGWQAAVERRRAQSGGKHEYTLAQYGLDEQELLERLDSC